jgi:hypothetical protein
MTIDVERLAALLDHHWLRQGIELGTASCTCGGWEFDAKVGQHPLPTMGERFAPFSEHVARAIAAEYGTPASPETALRDALFDEYGINVVDEALGVAIHDVREMQVNRDRWETARRALRAAIAPKETKG